MKWLMMPKDQLNLHHNSSDSLRHALGRPRLPGFHTHKDWSLSLLIRVARGSWLRTHKLCYMLLNRQGDREKEKKWKPNSAQNWIKILGQDKNWGKKKASIKEMHHQFPLLSLPKVISCFYRHWILQLAKAQQAKRLHLSSSLLH